MNNIKSAANLINNSGYTTVFTGAGISVDSGIPAFRGKNGLWQKYDPSLLSINYFSKEPESSWEMLIDIYKIIKDASPNKAHEILVWMEEEGYIDQIITQNIDGLHQRAGNMQVYEFHGNYLKLVCVNCGEYTEEIDLKDVPPTCNYCGEILKPDIVFFGEAIPEPVRELSFLEAENADVFLIIGTSGQVAPANMIPQQAKQLGTKIIEISPEATYYTNNIVDIFLQGKASELLEELYNNL